MIKSKKDNAIQDLEKAKTYLEMEIVKQIFIKHWQKEIDKKITS